MSRLYDRILRDPKVASVVKDSLSEARVIVLDSVCKWLFEETEQERWDFLTDFPNVAPPYEHAFYDVRAPSKMVSEETGVNNWPLDRPTSWGLEVLAIKPELDDLESWLRMVAKVEESQANEIWSSILEQKPKWQLETHFYSEGGELFNFTRMPWWCWSYLVREDGQFVRVPMEIAPKNLVIEGVDTSKKDILWLVSGPSVGCPDIVREKVKTTPGLASSISKGFPWVHYIQCFATTLIHCKNSQLVEIWPDAPLYNTYSLYPCLYVLLS